MKLIDRYVYAVTERLPENMREDIKRELYANIEDMLPENPSEDDIKNILENFGNPIKLANEYSQIKRYLIGPDIYDSYISVLKLVTGIIAIVFTILAVLGAAVNPLTNKGLIDISIDLFTNIISAVFEGIVQGFLWVTIVFVIIERTGVKEGKIPFIKKKWSVDDLPEIPAKNRRKISRAGTAVGMFFTMFFLIILYFRPEFIGIYSTGQNGVALVEPLLTTGRLQSYMPLIVIIAFLSFCVQIWKFITMKYDIPLAVANTLCNSVLCILLLIMIGDASILNNNFIPGFADITKIPVSQVNYAWQIGVKVFIFIFILANLWDSIDGFIKCKK